MSLTVWLLLGLGAFVLYSAYKGVNPFAWAVTTLGIPTKADLKLKGVRA